MGHDFFNTTNKNAMMSINKNLMWTKYLYDDTIVLCVQPNMLQCLWCSECAKYCGRSWLHVPSYILRKGCDENIFPNSFPSI